MAWDWLHEEVWIWLSNEEEDPARTIRDIILSFGAPIGIALAVWRSKVAAAGLLHDRYRASQHRAHCGSFSRSSAGPRRSRGIAASSPFHSPSVAFWSTSSQGMEDSPPCRARWIRCVVRISSGFPSTSNVASMSIS